MAERKSRSSLGLMMMSAFASRANRGPAMGRSVTGTRARHAFFDDDFLDVEAVHDRIAFNLPALHVEAFALAGLFQRRDFAISEGGHSPSASSCHAPLLSYVVRHCVCQGPMELDRMACVRRSNFVDQDKDNCDAYCRKRRPRLRSQSLTSQFNPPSVSRRCGWCGYVGNAFALSKRSGGAYLRRPDPRHRHRARKPSPQTNAQTIPQTQDIDANHENALNPADCPAVRHAIGLARIGGARPRPSRLADPGCGGARILPGERHGRGGPGASRGAPAHRLGE